MKKLILGLLIIGFTLVIAGTNWIDFSTGKYQCDSGYSGQLSVCVKSSSWLGADYCRRQVSDICN